VSAADDLYTALGKGVAHAQLRKHHIDAHRAQVLAEAKNEVVAWLVKKAGEQETWDAAVRAEVDAYRAQPRHLEGRGDSRGPGMVRAQEIVSALAAGKDTRDATQPPAGESTQAAPGPDVHSIIMHALAGGTDPLPLPAATVRLLTNRITAAVAPLVPYRRVWDNALPPGGYVCVICGDPVESEPCPQHAPEQAAPDFFEVGRTYTARDGSTFRCDAVTTHPDSGWRVALGWHTDTADWTFVAVRTIDHWNHEYNQSPTEAGEAL
jgi:hypothetical protein